MEQRVFIYRGQYWIGIANYNTKIAVSHQECLLKWPRKMFLNTSEGWKNNQSWKYAIMILGSIIDIHL